MGAVVQFGNERRFVCGDLLCMHEGPTVLEHEGPTVLEIVSDTGSTKCVAAGGLAGRLRPRHV